jgi:ketosteroid isomerase-like protein
MSKSDIAKIRTVIRQYVAACNAGDLPAFEKTLDREMIFMPPDARQAKGRKATSAAVKSALFDPFKLKLGVTKIGPLFVLGSRAFGTGSFTLELTPRSGGNGSKSAGKYIHAFRKQRDGSWKYTHVIFNNDKPPA